MRLFEYMIDAGKLNWRGGRGGVRVIVDISEEVQGLLYRRHQRGIWNGGFNYRGCLFDSRMSKSSIF